MLLYESKGESIDLGESVIKYLYLKYIIYDGI
jgi:hypothetical protein